jgi:hypothetical protein
MKVAPKKRKRRSNGRARPAASRRKVRQPKSRKSVEATAVTAAELRALRRQIQQKSARMRWNPETDDVQRSVAQLVLTVVEFLRRLMERQAIRRMENKTLTPKEVEAVGVALMQLEDTIKEIGRRFGLTPEDLNLDLGPVGKLM